jgi:hydroxyacylglutathione hydrolase
MPRIPLEDNYVDVLSKAQRGLKLTDDDVAARAGIPAGAWTQLLGGQVSEPTLRAAAKALGLGEKALLALARRTWYPEQPVFPRGFAMFNTAYGDMGVNSYLIWDVKTRHAAAFDTGATAGPMLDTLHAEGLLLRYVFVTHGHEDHIADLTPLLATGAELWASELEQLPHPATKVFKENAHFHVGALAIKTLLTSGHSPGLTTYFVSGLSWPLAIVGDALFASSIGGSQTHFAEQWRNDREKIFTLPADTVLACGHGPLTTLKQEKANNPFFSR